MKRFLFILTILTLLLLFCAPAFASTPDVNFEYMDHESRPHIPSPWKQADVAAGVGISTVGIVIVNALTKTSVFGNASFNGSFDPMSASPSGQAPTGGTGSPSGPGGAQAPSGGAAGTSGTAGTGSASTATGAGASAAQAVPTPQVSANISGSASSGGFIGTIKDFFKNLLDGIRDMLTDEGRSYASGKLSEIIDNVVPDEIDKE